MDLISDLEQMTNDRLRQERGEVAIVAPNDVISGRGSEYIMAPFTYRNPGGSRFSNGQHGVYYTARTLPTAIEETKYHRQIFMSHTKENPMRLEMRVLTADLDGNLHDIRGMLKKLPQVYSRTSYAVSQELGGRLVKESSYGITYDSVRNKGGQCAAIFRPPVLSNCRHERNLVFEWDGMKIGKVYELRTRSDGVEALIRRKAAKRLGTSYCRCSSVSARPTHREKSPSILRGALPVAAGKV